MSRLKHTFQKLNNKKALIPFVTAGHPHPDWTVDTMHALVASGANVIELGIPFSDPMADGEVIQLSSEKAIEQGVGLIHVLDMVAQFRQKDNETPVVLMGYLNPIESMGYPEFVAQAQKSGVDGVLLVDSPVEESAKLLDVLAEADMDQIFLVAPTTTEQRIKHVVSHAAGFVYYVALKGVTGSSDLDTSSVNQDVSAIKAVTDVPVAVGFGVKDASSAVAVAEVADAVVIGSALVKTLDGCETNEAACDAVGAFLSPIRAALDASV